MKVRSMLALNYRLNQRYDNLSDHQGTTRFLLFLTVMVALTLIDLCLKLLHVVPVIGLVQFAGLAIAGISRLLYFKNVGKPLVGR